MTICISRCVLMILLATLVIRNGICNDSFAVQRESLGRYIRERKLRLAARDLRDTDQRVYDICLKYGFDSQQTFTAFSPAPFISRRVPTVKRITIAPTEARPSKPADAFCLSTVRSLPSS